MSETLSLYAADARLAFDRPFLACDSERCGRETLSRDWTIVA